MATKTRRKARPPKQRTGKKGVSSADAAPCRFRVIPGDARTVLDDLARQQLGNSDDAAIRRAILDETHNAVERLPTFTLIAMLPVIAKHGMDGGRVPEPPRGGA
ncbi:MAG TPA: hypothetical protein VM487_10515 [Phycisphaerae bacterium]|nr:hypothetical protein [Phycisphaerae bacterium]